MIWVKTFILWGSYTSIKCDEILLKHWIDQGGEGVILDSHGQGDLTVLKQIFEEEKLFDDKNMLFY